MADNEIAFPEIQLNNQYFDAEHAFQITPIKVINPNDFKNCKSTNELDICDCISDEVLDALYNWKKDNKPDFKYEGITGIFNVISCNNNLELIGYDEKLIIIEVLSIINLSMINDKIYVPTFIKKYYEINYNQALAILHIIDFVCLISHRSGLRVPGLNDAGKNFLGSYENKENVADMICDFALKNNCTLDDN